MNAMIQPAAAERGNMLADFKRLALVLDLDPMALMQRAGIDSRYLDDPETPVPVRSMVELLQIAADASGIEDFGLRLGEARGLPDFGPAVLMLREEATVRDALRTLVALMHLHSEEAHLHLEENEAPVLTLHIAGEVGDCGQAVDSSLAGLTHILRWLLGESWTPAVIRFTHGRPASTARYDRFFRCPLEFQSSSEGIVLRKVDLDAHLPALSPILRRQVERYIHTLDIEPTDIYVYRVTQVIAMALPRGEAKADVIARYLGTYRQNLNRRLARAGLNYSAVVEKVRKNLAVQYMLGSDRSLSHIAGLIGFGSLSAFTRWFHQSFDCAPSVWRKAQR